MGRPDEDRRSDFEHGGWAAPYAAMVQAGDSLSYTGALLLGRRTYEDFYAFWPNQTNNPYTEMLNNTQKYVECQSSESHELRNELLKSSEPAENVPL